MRSVRETEETDDDKADHNGRRSITAYSPPVGIAPPSVPAKANKPGVSPACSALIKRIFSSASFETARSGLLRMRSSK